MNRAKVARLHAQFERTGPRETPAGAEYWLARELQKLLGYRRWDDFARVIHRAAAACEQADFGELSRAGHDAADHFLDVAKLALPERSRKRASVDFALTRYACYLIARSGDASKDRVAFAESYFAVPTRQLEHVEHHLDDAERLRARAKLSQSEKVLSGLIYERAGDVRACGRVRSKGDEALFDGLTTREMKERLGMPNDRALADFLPTIVLKAKIVATERTDGSIKRDYLHTEATIAREHVKNHREVRKLLRHRKVVPEDLPAAEDAKKVERRLAAAEKLLPELADHLEAIVGA